MRHFAFRSVPTRSAACFAGLDCPLAGSWCASSLAIVSRPPIFNFQSIRNRGVEGDAKLAVSGAGGSGNCRTTRWVASVPHETFDEAHGRTCPCRKVAPVDERHGALDDLVGLLA